MAQAEKDKWKPSSSVSQQAAGPEGSSSPDKIVTALRGKVKNLEAEVRLFCDVVLWLCEPYHQGVGGTVLSQLFFGKTCVSQHGPSF